MRLFSSVLAATLLAVPLQVGLAQEPDERRDEAAQDPAGKATTTRGDNASPRNPARPSTDGKPVAFDRRWLEPFFSATPGLRAAAEKFRVEDWKGAATDFAALLPKLPRLSPDQHPAQFALATARMNLGEWAKAGALFEDLWTVYPLLAPYHAYNAARCRLRQGDTEGALQWVERVAPKTIPEAEAALVKIDALASLQRWNELDTETARFLDHFAAGPRRAEAMFRRGQAMEALGRPAQDAAAIYRRIWTEAPMETWSTKATERLAALAGAAAREVAAQLGTHTGTEWIGRGMVLFDRNQNVESEAAFVAALAAPGLTPALACKAQYHRAQSVWKQRARPRAAPLFKEAVSTCQAAGEKDLLVKALYQGGRCLASAGDRAGALANYARIEAEHAEHSYADDARLRAAEIATDDGRNDDAATLLASLPKRYPSGDLAGEALWRLALVAIRAENWDRAMAALDENLRLLPHEDIWYAEGRALYWKGRVLERQKHTKSAVGFYARAVKEYPLSVYALFSLERLRRAAPQERSALIKSLHATLTTGGGAATAGSGEKHGPWQFAPRPVFGEPGFLRAVELARMGMGGDARRELARLGLSGPDNRDAARQSSGQADEGAPGGRDDLLWISAVLLDRGRVWSASHSIPRYTVRSYRQAYPAGRGNAEWCIAYPRAFPELVSKNCRENHVPEALQLAIMREESAFSPRIESFANALGLTQMVVKTAQRFTPDKVTRDTLLDPVGNLQLGSRFLAFLLEHFNGAVPLAISGYNAGEGAVDRWLKERGTLDQDEFIETIPFDETRNYTKRVLATYFAYSWLYATDKPVPSINFSLKPALAKPAHVGRPGGRGHTRRPVR